MNLLTRALFFIQVNFKRGKLKSGRHPSSYHQSFSCYVRGVIGSQKGDCWGHVVCAAKPLKQGLILNRLPLQYFGIHLSPRQVSGCSFFLIIETTQSQKFKLTMVWLPVMKSAKCVGTNPGAIQFTRVWGAISAASTYKVSRKYYAKKY